VLTKKTIGNATLYCGDSNEVLEQLTDIDSCVTDPPYGLSFMGKSWDYDVPQKELWEKVFASLKNGSHLLSFFGSRTYHRGAIPIEDAGFEIRDQLMWLYGSGFPKSHNIGKAVDKLQGNEREVVGKNPNSRSAELHKKTVYESGLRDNAVITKGNSEWEGWGTALKPAHEPIVMARKPFKGSVANNVLEHGTGGINIDECRVGTDDMKFTKASSLGNNMTMDGGKANKDYIGEDKQGRFPANVMHDGSDLVQEIFPKTGKSSGGRSYQNTNQMYSGGWADEMGNKTDPGFGDEGTAARYFYCPKASKKDRDEGNNHPTVKPTELMRYLCRLVTPKGGIVLDPFMGSGSTGKAAILEGFHFVGIELDPDYFEIACARIEKAVQDKNKELF
jgi:site-specific DNA-methyltransferase (adenine-specific)